MPFLLDEDSALKVKLQTGLSPLVNYSDGKQKPVDIYFRFPDPEERQRRFPHVAIDLIGVEFDPQRAHRALGLILQQDLETATPPSGFYMTDNDFPLPWTLLYQLATYTRDPVQDRQLTSQLYMMFPEQFGSLYMGNYDGTVRRADLISVVRRDTVDRDGKRLYRNIFTIGVSSEFYFYEVQFVQQAITMDPSFVGIGADSQVEGEITRPVDPNVPLVEFDSITMSDTAFGFFEIPGVGAAVDAVTIEDPAGGGASTSGFATDDISAADTAAAFESSPLTGNSADAILFRETPFAFGPREQVGADALTLRDVAAAYESSPLSALVFDYLTFSDSATGVESGQHIGLALDAIIMTDVASGYEPGTLLGKATDKIKAKDKAVQPKNQVATDALSLTDIGSGSGFSTDSISMVDSAIGYESSPPVGNSTDTLMLADVAIGIGPHTFHAAVTDAVKEQDVAKGYESSPLKGKATDALVLSTTASKNVRFHQIRTDNISLSDIATILIEEDDVATRWTQIDFSDSLTTGVTVYTPNNGDLLLDWWVEIDTAFDGQTPYLDMGTFDGNGLGLLQTYGAAPIAMWVPDAAPANNTGLLAAGIQPNPNGASSWSAALATLGFRNGPPVPRQQFDLDGSPFIVVMTQDGSLNVAVAAKVVGTSQPNGGTFGFNITSSNNQFTFQTGTPTGGGGSGATETFSVPTNRNPIASIGQFVTALNLAVSGSDPITNYGNWTTDGTFLTFTSVIDGAGGNGNNIGQGTNDITSILGLPLPSILTGGVAGNPGSGNGSAKIFFMLSTPQENPAV